MDPRGGGICSAGARPVKVRLSQHLGLHTAHGQTGGGSGVGCLGRLTGARTRTYQQLFQAHSRSPLAQSSPVLSWVYSDPHTAMTLVSQAACK